MKINPKDIPNGIEMAIGLLIAVAAFVSGIMLTFIIFEFIINLYHG